MYLVISRGNDEPCFEVLDKQELLETLNELTTQYEFLEDLLELQELPECFPSQSMIIIKAEVIVPEVVDVVKQYTIT